MHVGDGNMHASRSSPEVMSNRKEDKMRQNIDGSQLKTGRLGYFNISFLDSSRLF
jgi:hypothetical protein